MPNDPANAVVTGLAMMLFMPFFLCMAGMLYMVAGVFYLFLKIILLLIIFIVFATITSFTLAIKIVVSIIIILAVVMMMANQNIRDYIIYLLIFYPLPTEFRLGDIFCDNRPTSQQR